MRVYLIYDAGQPVGLCGAPGAKVAVAKFRRKYGMGDAARLPAQNMADYRFVVQNLRP